MFDRIGKKIKLIAKVVFGFGVISGGLTVILCGCIGHSMDRYYGSMNGLIEGLLVGGIIAAIEVFLAWLGSLLTYGFGQLVDDTELTKYTCDRILRQIEKSNRENAGNNALQNKTAPVERNIRQTAQKTKSVDAANEETKVTVNVDGGAEKDNFKNSIYCPSCHENLDFMGYSKDSIIGETCPFCGAKIN